MITPDQVNRELAFASVISETCPACGRSKPAQHSLCPGCLLRLPGTSRQALCRRIGDGYEEAVVDALNFLEAERFHHPPRSKSV